MAVAVVFSAQKVYTNKDPLKIVLGKGVHEIEKKKRKIVAITAITLMSSVMPVGNPNLNVICSHITFVGKGKDQTTIRGGFDVNNQQNIKFEELTITNSGGYGLVLEGSETNVGVLKCAVKECRGGGMSVRSGATVTATQCEFMENGSNGVYCAGATTKARLNDCTVHHNGEGLGLGLFRGTGLNAFDHAVVDLHGTKTDIHSNKGYGILADRRAKVNIHLPSQHNTSHGNSGDNRRQETRGSIANINADGTFT